MKDQLATLAERTRFDEIIDVRTPAEFADDHIPGALNAPVLSNEERVVVGTLYKQDPFAATRMGAAMVARNLAQHLDNLFADRPPQWRPLIYCWRGGKRSGAMTAWMNLIGWRARQLEGGYKAYRQWVLDALLTEPARHQWVVLSGLTGTGKTRLLQALAEQGAQVLDLEALACHRGSLLGAWPTQAQPGQKRFDSLLVGQLTTLDPGRPVFVEAESKRVGQVHLPKTLMTAMQQGRLIEITASQPARLAYLCQEYAHWFDEPALFKQQLARLTELQGKDTIHRWQQLVDARAIDELFAELLQLHYDPAYRRSNPTRHRQAEHRLEIDPGHALDDAARSLLNTLGEAPSH
ncbi:tRNA 2-selenouridine(34) synthase MnmH [Chitinimonas sp. BJYL2]|uniref:tRNA 2-selenouridine(34) synthase MnmH n=1 Tax=Chitinimonas sp. BJYL2 TaxID=2976696 RepID=UPI0022B4D3F3|nr:tRNA 2-selenouridine(34) synthase MnmH [Chitinimonas sp. BJYL2]